MAILRRNCPHCPAESVAFTLIHASVVPNKQHHIWNCCALCGACNNPIAFVATAARKQPPDHESPQGYNGNIEPRWEIPIIWPSRQPQLAPPHTPASVARRFLEGEDSFKRHNWNSAVAMYRSALDIATKAMEGVPKNVTFFERLKWLHENHKITPDIKSWADHVRVEGNAALHDPEEFDENDAKALRFFTEMFLRYVFELPGAVKEFQGETHTGPEAAT